jgi:PAS domain S-box-containing protein
MSEAKLRAENEELRRLLEESESTLSAIRNGEVDALVIGGKEIYTLEGADHPYRVLVEAMQQGAVTLSAEGTVIYCNAGFAKMVGRQSEKMIGANIRTLFASGDLPVFEQRLADAREVGKQEEFSLKSDDGSSLPVVVSFNLLDLNGVSAICLVITDLTEHRHNLQLLDSDRRKDEFLAMLAHELRNPLAPISNAAQMLNLWNQNAHQEVTWACDVVERQVRQMTRIVDDLLDVSRITRGKIKLQMAPVDVASIVAAAVETSRPLIESRKHTLNIQFASQPLKITADFTRMAQVVTNLLNNAAKYTEEEGEIWLVCERDGSDASVSVRDNGAGMPAEMIPTVFDLFTQADRTIDRSQGGLGIGLTLVRSLVALHQGSVEAHSGGLGSGSEFVIRIPLIASGREPEDEQSVQNVKSVAPVFSQRILVVDDNVDSATTMALMLKTMGHEAVVVYDGPAAIETAVRVSPTLILLDIGLPGMNGYVVAEQLRATPGLGNVLIAALTGYGDEQDRKRSREAGFDYHFVKPLGLPQLQSLLRTTRSELSNGSSTMNQT